MKRKTKIIITVVAVLLVIGITIGIIAVKNEKVKSKEITETTISTTESTTENTTETTEDILTTAESETETEATSANQTKTAPAKANSNYSNKSSSSNNNKSSYANSNNSYSSSNSTPKPETTNQQTDNREHPATGTVVYSRPNWGDYYDYGKNWQYAKRTYEWEVDEYGGYWSSSTDSTMSGANLDKYVNNNLKAPDRDGSYTGEQVIKKIWVWIE